MTEEERTGLAPSAGPPENSAAPPESQQALTEEIERTREELGETVGWPEFIQTVGSVWHSLPADQRSHVRGAERAARLAAPPAGRPALRRSARYWSPSP